MRNALLLPLALVFLNACLQGDYEGGDLTAPVLAQDAAPELEYSKIGWIWNDLPAGLKIAADEDKLVLIDFWAGWCYWCVKMDEEAMNSSAVVEMVMKNYVPVKIDTDLSQNNGLLKTYRIIGTPAFVVLDRDERITAQTLGYMSEEEFLTFLRRGLDAEGR